MIFLATSKLGLESTVSFELRKLNFENIKASDGSVSFEGSFDDMARALIYLRTAERLYWKLSSFTAKSFSELFDNIRQMDFKGIITPHNFIHVKGKSAKSTLFSVSDCQSIAKKAIVENLKSAYNTEIIPEDGPEIIIDIAILKDEVTVSVDCCGAGLSRRGYRTYNVAAPISETLGAGLVLLSRYWPDLPLIDPMCGSGTIPIEAAMIGNNIPPSLNRSFASEKWQFLDRVAFIRAREEGRDNIKNDSLPIVGYDIDPRSISVAKAHAQKAGVSIPFEIGDVRNLKTNHDKGIILCNPPYGERMLQSNDIISLYKDMRHVFDTIPGFKIGIISAVNNFESIYGKKSDTRRNLSNGGMPCTFYQYYPLKNKIGAL